MKSRGFSPDAHYFKYVAKRYSWLALISLVLIGFHTWAGWFLFGRDTVGAGYVMDGVTGEYYFGSNMREIISFSIINYTADLGKTLPCFSSIIALLYALVLFGFLWRKNECFTTLSHGVSLRKQFLIRYLFGAGLMTLCDALSFGLSYAIHLNQIGGDTTGLTLPYSLCYFAVYIVLELCIYTLSVLFAVLSGRFLDCLISVGGILAAPYAIGNMLRHIFANFLHGSALGLPENSLFITDAASEFNSILMYAKKFGAFTAFEDVLYGVPIPASGDPKWLKDMVIEAYREEYIKLPWLPFFLCLAAMITAAVVACVVFCRRPAEYAGKAGIYPPVYVTSAFLIAVGISSFIGELPINRYLLMLLICAAFLLVFFILVAVYRASIKSSLKHCPSALGGVSALLLCVLICAFGAFGYSDYIPETAEIESAVINYVGNPTVLGGPSVNLFYSGYSVFSPTEDVEFNQITKSVSAVAKLSWWKYMNELPVLTDDEDVEAVRDIHRYVINSGMKTRGDCKLEKDVSDSAIQCNFYVVYTLKDGRRVERFYRYLTLDAIEKVCSIETCQGFKETYLDYRLDSDDSVYTVYKSGTTAFEAADEFFSDIVPLDTLTTEQNDALFEALTYDFADLSYEDRYFSDDKVLGIIRFAQSYKTSGDGTMVYFDGGRKPEDRDGCTWYITEKYARTLSFLESYGLTGIFDGKMTVTKVETIEFDPYLAGNNPTGYGSFFAIQSFDNVIHTDKGATLTSIPEAEWDDYIGRSRAIAATTRGGTLLRITYTNSSSEHKVIDRLIPNN